MQNAMPPKKIQAFMALSIIATCFCSCSTYRYIYTASPPNNPYFTKKHESKLTAYYAASNNNQGNEIYAGGLDLQAAYALSNHWAITGTYFNSREKDDYGGQDNSPFDSSAVKYKRNLFETGVGYFVPLDKNIMFNLYAGVGLGKFSIDDNGAISAGTYYSRYHTSNITKWFIQPALNFRPQKNFHFSIILKSSFVHFGNITTSYTDYELQYFELDRFSNRTIFFMEPALNLQLGLQKYPWVKLDWMIAGVSKNAYTEYNVRQNNIAIGLSFDFSKITKKTHDKYSE